MSASAKKRMRSSLPPFKVKHTDSPGEHKDLLRLLPDRIAIELEDSDGSTKSSKNARNGPKTKSFSKEKSFGIQKDRPSTIVGPPLSMQRPPRPPASQRLDESPTRPTPVIVQPMSEKTNRSRYSTLVESETRTSADGSDLLRYSLVSCNLLSDPDLQHAMFKSASAKNIPKVNPSLQTSNSAGTITSESSGDLAEDNATMPYMDDQDGGSYKNRDSAYISYTNLLEDDGSGIVMRTGSSTSLDKSRSESNMKPELPPRNPKLAGSSSDSKLPPPRPAPRSSASPNTPPTNMGDRVIRPNVMRERPKPAPRRHSLEQSNEQNNSGDLLISLETPPEENEHFSLVGQFDSVEVGGEYVTLRNAKAMMSPRNDNRRSSVSRTPAMKLLSTETPKRPSISRERSPVSPDEDSPQTGSMLDFDPLFHQSASPQLNKKTETQSNVQSDSNNSNNNSLLMDRNLKDLTTMSNSPVRLPIRAPHPLAQSFGGYEQFEQLLYPTPTVSQTRPCVTQFSKSPRIPQHKHSAPW